MPRYFEEGFYGGYYFSKQMVDAAAEELLRSCLTEARLEAQAISRDRSAHTVRTLCAGPVS